jgi:hypothetical protein
MLLGRHQLEGQALSSGMVDMHREWFEAMAEYKLMKVMHTTQRPNCEYTKV